MNLKESTVLITGASRGLGAALAQELASRGAKIALAARRRDALAAVASDIRDRGGQAEAFSYDAADPEGGHRLAAQVAAHFGPIDLVVHNASTLGSVPLRPLLETDPHDVEAAFAVNLLGPLRLTQAVAGSMALRGRGLLVAITSDAATAAYPTWGAYGSSKAALELCMRTLAAELEGTGVRVLLVDPGEMDTQMHAAAVPDANRAELSRPETIALRLVDIVQNDAIASGSRLEASAPREGE